MPLKRSREQETPTMYKSKLQAVCQQRGWELPTYQVTKQGKDHNPLFSATVTVNATSFSSPSPSSSSKTAQSDAAKLAFNHFSLISSPSPSRSVSAAFSGGSAGENTRLSQENPTPLSNTNPTPLSNEAGAVAKTDESFGVSAGCSSGSAGGNARLSPRGKLQLNLQAANPIPLSNEAVAVGKNDESFEGCSSGSAGGNARLSPRGKLQLNLQAANPTPLSNEAVAVGKNDESFEGCSSGSAGGNARLSPRGKLQLNLQAANPTPLSNEAVAVGKNDESFEGCSSGSAGGDSCLFPGGKLQLNLQDANPTPLSNEAVAVGKNDESFGVSAGFSSGNAGGNTRLSPRGKLQLNLQVANPTPLSNEAMAVGKNDESFGGCSSGSAGENTRLSPGGKLQLNLQDANPTPLSNEAVANAKNDEIFGGMQHLFKNQLQTYAQKRNFTLPVYSCERVGPPHASRFKCKVTVNGQTYESEEYFPTLIKAELAAAKAALMSLLSNGVEEDESGYKNLLQDMARREGCGLPTYWTDKSGEAHVPTFVSKVEIEGEIFTGQGAKTKKQAEMSAAKIAYTALQQRYSSQSPGFLSTSSQFQEAPRSSPLSPARQSQEAVQSETPQFSVSNLRAGLTAYLQQNIQPKLPVSNEQAEEYRANSVVSNHNPSIASPGQDSCSAMASITPSPAAAISSSPKHDLTSSSLPSDSPTNLATSSSIEFMVRGIRVLMHPSGTKMTYPAGSTVLPISDDKWAAVELPPQRSR
ncbi:double-stranded RNA-binding protein 1 isoform X12 [Populus trichocarpa]|uniref:double-stranded RNA-binding protein 1 isoform X12 n=1 Tax=Populus trichocarpa TaxID=3694 RepID=UPI0022780D60|nr:double-stranded RNA-binding protein 1 isoform X12 [Populus trichocarpa]